ncbi:MAG: sulfite oxidase [Propionibacteriales bacterium]|nr:sulfite oxidase [Propionibacteriales bacterium]
MVAARSATSGKPPGGSTDEGAAATPIVKPLPAEWFVDHDTNAEMRWESAADQRFATANERFFVRSHTRTPRIDAETYQLELFGDGLTGSPTADQPLTMSLDELKAMPPYTLNSFLECTGNGRALFDIQQGMSVPGTPWLLGGIGMATWRGVRLSSVLRWAGLRVEAVDVMAIGLDDPYVSDGVDHGRVRRPLPVSKALDDCILALEMNGELLPPDHGFPVRLVVPGWVGIASIKWLGQLEVSTRRLESPWNTYWYRMTGGQYPTDSPPLADVPVRSSFELPWGAVFAAGEPVVLCGRSWSGAAPIERVEVSLDGGQTWQSPRLGGPNGKHSWARWELPWVPCCRGRYELLARATDKLGRTQPDTVPFNNEGYLFWAVVRHPVTVV